MLLQCAAKIQEDLGLHLICRLGRAAAHSAASHPTRVHWLPAVPAQLQCAPAAANNGSAAKLLAARMLHASGTASAPDGAEAKPSLGGMPASDLKSTGSGAPGSAGDRDACVPLLLCSARLLFQLSPICRWLAACGSKSDLTSLKAVGLVSVKVGVPDRGQRCRATCFGGSP